jgi:hypothetical protein
MPFIAEDDEKARSMPSDNLIVRQQGGVADTTAFEFAGGTGFIIELGITVNTAGIAIAYFDLELSWEKICFLWLPDPLESGDCSTRYQFGDNNSLAYARSQVINHCADVCQTL